MGHFPQKRESREEVRRRTKAWVDKADEKVASNKIGQERRLVQEKKCLRI